MNGLKQKQLSDLGVKHSSSFSREGNLKKNRIQLRGVELYYDFLPDLYWHLQLQDFMIAKLVQNICKFNGLEFHKTIWRFRW